MRTTILTALLVTALATPALAQSYPVSGRWGESTSSEKGPIDCTGNRRVIDFSGNQRTDSNGGVPEYRNKSVESVGQSNYRIVDEFSNAQVSARPERIHATQDRFRSYRDESVRHRVEPAALQVTPTPFPHSSDQLRAMISRSPRCTGVALVIFPEPRRIRIDGRRFFKALRRRRRGRGRSMRKCPSLRTCGAGDGTGEQQRHAEHLAPGSPFGERLIGS